MVKFNWKKALVSSLIILLPMLAGLVLWNKLPDFVPTHFSIDGQADNFSHKAFAVFGMPGIMLAIHWLCLLLSGKQMKEQSKKVVGIVYWILPAISVCVCGMCYLLALGRTVDASMLICILVGGLFIYLGNYLPKTKRNRRFGIKLPWTMGNDENWIKTHRLGGKLWVAGGFLVLIAMFLPMEWMIAILVPSFLIMMIVPVVYSYRLYRGHRKQGVVYDTKQATKAEKLVVRISLAVVAILLVAVAFLMFTGNIRLRLEKDYFTIESTYWSDAKINYDSVDSIELRQEMVSGSRTYGFGSARLSLGTYQSQEFGRYTRYTYTGNDACIVLRCGENVLVISGRTDKQTEQWYQQLLKRIS